MNNPNPFVPQGSLEQNKRRSRMKLGVFCVLAIGVVGLTAMLIQGCKRETETTDNSMSTAIDTNTPAIDTNASPLEASNPPVTPAPMATAPTPPVEGAGTEYIVIKGDSFSSIAKKFGVRVRAIEDANPNIAPTKLRVGQKLSIPAPTANTAAETSSMAPANGEELYTVKSGDTLTKIAKAHGVTIKAIKSENSLTTDHIKVGQKLRIPAKAETAAPAATSEPVSTNTP